MELFNRQTRVTANGKGENFLIENGQTVVSNGKIAEVSGHLLAKESRTLIGSFNLDANGGFSMSVQNVNDAQAACYDAIAFIESVKNENTQENGTED